MAFNPTLPLDNSLMVAGQMRSQFNGLKTLIDDVPAGPPGPPGPGLNFCGDWQGGDSYAAGDVIYYTGQCYVAVDPNSGTPPGVGGAWRLLSIVGPPGEVTTAQLDSAIMGTARNPTGVSPLYITVSDPPTQADVQAVVSKLNELILAARREP